MRRKRPCLPGLFRASAFLPCAFVIVLLMAVPGAHAQDVAEAARRELARKAAQSSSQGSEQRHIYTNEDLTRARILTSRDRATVEARKKNPTAPGSKVSQTLDAANGSPAKSPDIAPDNTSQSLGEVARSYRAAKTAREQQAVVQKLQPRAPYHLNLPRVSHAAPNPMMLPPIVSTKPIARLNTATAAVYAVIRRDPFLRPHAGSEPRNLRAPLPPTNLIPEGISPLAKKTFPLPPADNVRPAIAIREHLYANDVDAVAPSISTGSLRPDELFPAQAKQPSAPERLGADFFSAVHPHITGSNNVIALEPNPPAPVLRDSIRLDFASSGTGPHRLTFPFTIVPRSVTPATSFTAPVAPVIADSVPPLPRAISPRPAARGPGTLSSVAPTGIFSSPVSWAEWGHRTISVRPGDSLWSLSRRYLGHGSRWQEWLVINPTLVEPRHIRPGTILSVPVATAIPTSKAASRPGTTTDGWRFRGCVFEAQDGSASVRSRLHGTSAMLTDFGSTVDLNTTTFKEIPELPC